MLDYQPKSVADVLSSAEVKMASRFRTGPRAGVRRGLEKAEFVASG